MTPAPQPTLVGLPDTVRACLFDLDGVLTRTAEVHDAAWTDAFDAYLRERAAATGEPFVPFDPVDDYARYVDGKRRNDGVRSFLASRGITLPEGDVDDPPTAQTVWGIGNRKDVMLHERLARDGVRVYDDAVTFLRAARDAALATAVVSSSANTRAVLAAAGLDGQFDVIVDGVAARERNLPGKPAPDTFLAAAADLGLDAPRSVVFEDAVAGVAAGRAGGFARVIGVDRVGGAHAEDLQHNGADLVLRDLTTLIAPDPSLAAPAGPDPSATPRREVP